MERCDLLEAVIAGLASVIGRFDRKWSPHDDCIGLTMPAGRAHPRMVDDRMAKYHPGRNFDMGKPVTS